MDEGWVDLGPTLRAKVANAAINTQEIAAWVVFTLEGAGAEIPESARIEFEIMSARARAVENVEDNS